MAARERRFSFMRLISNAFPNMAHDDPNDVDLSPKQADDLLRYQLMLPHPRYLSKKVHKALVKNKLILPVPEDGDAEALSSEVTMTVNTSGMTKNFASQLAVISVHAQRMLVGMLFFWEECTRWKLLDDEEREILRALETGENRDLAVALEAVEMKKKMLPSQRAERTANVGEGRGHDLPSYA